MLISAVDNDVVDNVDFTVSQSEDSERAISYRIPFYLLCACPIELCTAS